MDLLAALRSFVRVAQTGSFSAVAQERGVTQPAISRHVSALEAELGVRLVHRSTQAVTLTDEGHTFLEAAERTLADVESLMGAVGERRGKAIGRVRVAMPGSLASFVASRLGELLGEHPSLAVDLISREGSSSLVEDGLDLEIRLGPLEDSSLVARLVGHAQAYLVAAPSYLASAPPLERPADLAEHACLVYQRWGRDDAWWFAADESPITVHSRLRANHADAIYRAALAGQGIALLSHLVVLDDIAAGHLVHVLPDHPIRRLPIHALFASREHLPARTQVVLAFITRLLAGDATMAP
jgi:DNA-binding transcriptional LysR family regulator